MEWKNEPAADRIIVALDCSPDEAVVLGEKLAGHARWVKIGMTLYYAVGPSIVNTMHKLGFRVFLDLKLHDIPHQVYGAANSIAKAGADLFTVHASGGADMMQSAEKGARKGFSESPREGEPPAVCAITVLTSMDASQLEAIGIDVPPAEPGGAPRPPRPRGQARRYRLLAHRGSPDEGAARPRCHHHHSRRATQGRRARRPEPRRHARRSLCRRRVPSRHPPAHHACGRSRSRAFDEIAANLELGKGLGRAWAEG